MRTWLEYLISGRKIEGISGQALNVFRVTGAVPNTLLSPPPSICLVLFYIYLKHVFILDESHYPCPPPQANLIIKQPRTALNGVSQRW